MQYRTLDDIYAAMENEQAKFVNDVTGLTDAQANFRLAENFLLEITPRPQTGERRVVDTSDPAVRRRLAASGAGDVREVCRRTNVDLLALSTAESYERPLGAFFKARERRR